MSADYLKWTPSQRLYLTYLVKGVPTFEIMDMLPNGSKDASGKPLLGMHRNTLQDWRKRDVDFAAAEERYTREPHLFHSEVIAPLMLAEQDAIYMEGLMGLGPRIKVTARDRELLLTEQGHLKQVETGASQVLLEILKGRSWEVPQRPALATTTITYQESGQEAIEHGR